MSEDPNRTTPERDQPDLKEELQEMGQQLERAFRAVVESERAKQLQKDVASGVREVTTQLRSAVDNLQQDPRVQQAENRGREALNTARETKLGQDIQDAFVTGLATLNTQLRKLVERIEQEATTPAATGTPSQQVPIEQEPPTTGETRRLDE
jgi:ribosome-associated translation inhibitor RaiA